MFENSLQAIRNTPKELTGITPCKEIFGYKAIICIKVTIQSLRVQKQNHLNEIEHNGLLLNQLRNIDETHQQALDKLVQNKESRLKAIISN